MAPWAPHLEGLSWAVGNPIFIANCGVTVGSVSLGHSLQIPPGTAVGDLMLCYMANRPNANAQTATYAVQTAGWTKLCTVSTAGYRAAIWYRYYTGAEGATVDCSMLNVSNGGFKDAAVIYTFRNVKQSAPFLENSFYSVTWSGVGNVSGVGVTCIKPHCLAVNLGHVFHASSNPSQVEITALAGAVGGNWVLESRPATGVMLGFWAQSASLDAAGQNIVSGTFTYTATGLWFNFGFALRPNIIEASVALDGTADQGAVGTKSPLMTIGLGANGALGAAQSPTYPVKPGASTRRGTQGSSVLLHRRKNWSRLRYVQGR